MGSIIRLLCNEQNLPIRNSRGKGTHRSKKFSALYYGYVDNLSPGENGVDGSEDPNERCDPKGLKSQ